MPIIYTPDTPKSTQPFNESQIEILNNFGAIDELISVNHVGFNGNGFGFHNYLTMPDQVIPTTPLGTDINMFARVTTGDNAPQLWLQYPTGDVAQLTGPQSAGVGTSGTGWSMFPSGIIMKWGTATLNSSSATITFPVGAGIEPFTEICAFIKVTPTSGYAKSFANFSCGNLGTLNFSVYNNPSTSSITFNWFAIGK